MDDRVRVLAENLIWQSVRLQPREKILIEVFDTGLPLATALIEEVYRVGGIPFVSVKNIKVFRQLLKEATVEQLTMTAAWESRRMENMDAYIGIFCAENIYELSDLPDAQLQYYRQYWSKPVHMDIRMSKTKWCVLRYPSSAMAQIAGSSTEAFENFYFKVCNLNYAKMGKAMEPLIQLMNVTDKVRIVGPGTDLSFSIKDVPAVACSAYPNIPGGEVYTAPVKNSINGCLTCNTPSVQDGTTYENIRVEFADGKIINAMANETEKLNSFLDIDEGSHYIGKFGIGLNPYIAAVMGDTLFDKKMWGSFHFTAGNGYNNAFNGNSSALHWDFVCIQTPEYGGGRIWFDDRLVRTNGVFVIPELEGLNPGNLL